MIEFAGGLINPKHVAYIGMDKSRPWRKGWSVTVRFSSGAVLYEELEDEKKAEWRFAQIQQQLKTSGAI
jgi:hypothetical protein